MASMEDAEELATLEIHKFPDHVDKPIAVYEQIDEEESARFTLTRSRVGHGDTVREALLDAAAEFGSNSGGSDAE